MRKTAIKLSKVKVGNGKRLWCVTWPKIGKGRNRQFFKDKTEAETVLKQKLIAQENYGVTGLSLNDRQRAEYLESVEKLQPFGVTIRDAVNFYLPHLQATKRTCTAAELVDEILRVKEADGASERYLSDLRSRLTQFSESFNGKPVAEITSAQIDEWLQSLSDKETGRRLSPVTRNNFRRVLGVAFQFATKHGYCVGNPAKQTAKAKVVESAVEILTPDETARLLEKADSSIIAFIALGAFAGLRRAELERLDWREVDLRSGLIQITAAKAKSARRRFVKIQANLPKWLQPHTQLAGPVAPLRYRELLDKARADAGIKDWPQNALRHSFASYHLAQFKNAAELALELGHTNARLVFEHYREVVRPKEATRYWQIAPSRGTKKVIAFATHSA